MKAIIMTAYGPPEVLEYRDVEAPVPGSNELLVEVVATTVFAGDCEIRGFNFPVSFWIPLRLMFGVFKPRKNVQIPGQELAGRVVSVGADVTGYTAGDEVFAPLERLGSCAEFVCLNAHSNTIALKPENMSFEEAATVPVGGLNALHFVRKARIQTGEKVLINGAAGSIGTFAVQLAKLAGAEVIAVDSASKRDMLRSIGADRVIDYRRENFTQVGESYDVIIDIVGKSPYGASVASLKPDGRYILGNPRFAGFFRGLWTSRTTSKNVQAVMTGYHKEDLEFLKDLVEQGKLKTVIDRRYTLEQIVEAHHYVESGQKAGHVVIDVRPTDSQPVR
jgi:NADPH:quinone reductase-like Zn-dependent oxidoreductase